VICEKCRIAPAQGDLVLAATGAGISVCNDCALHLCRTGQIIVPILHLNCDIPEGATMITVRMLDGTEQDIDVLGAVKRSQMQ
jgi:hypothetical protein